MKAKRNYSSKKRNPNHIIRLKNVLRGTIGNNKQCDAMSPVAKNERWWYYIQHEYQN